MQAQVVRWLRVALVVPALMCVAFAAGMGQAAPYAALVMDARNGEVIFARNHDTKLHPASLTKMMTLYVAFEAIKHGEVSLDQRFTVSRNAASTGCVCLGLRPGQSISLRYLLRAAALRSANDASVVIAEGISGSVEAFAQRMTRTARAMGMNNTTFRNPHGLTEAGHLSTARDMSILGRQLYFDYPQYYNLFSRRTEDAGVARVTNTNSRFLDSYAGADGIKTGFTRAAGFNLTASARRGDKHIIATMFGGTSTAARNAHVAELLDIGFSRAASRVATRAPRTPGYQGRGSVAVAQAPVAPAAPAAPVRNGDDDPTAAAKTIRLQLAVRKSLRPKPRPLPVPDEELLIAVADSVTTAIAALAPEPAPEPELDTAVLSPVVAALAPEVLPVTPRPRPESLAIAAPSDDVAPDLAPAIAAGFTIADPTDLAALAEDAVEIETAQAQPPMDDDEVDFARAPLDDDPVLAEAADHALLAIESSTPPAKADEATLHAELDATPAEEDVAHSTVALAEATPAVEEDTVWIGGEAAFLPDAPATELQTAVAILPDDTAAGVPTALNTAEPPAAEPLRSANPDIILTRTPSTDRIEPDTQSIAQVAEAQAAHGSETVRLSTSDGGRLWGVSLGQFTSRAAAERSLITVKMAEAAALGNGVSRIRQVSGRFEASVAGLTQTEAERACLRLNARSMDCLIATP